MGGIDYKRLGETTGKAWRLGHTNVAAMLVKEAIRDAKARMKVPSGQSQVDFHRGFLSGVAAVDKNRESGS